MNSTVFKLTALPVLQGFFVRDRNRSFSTAVQPPWSFSPRRCSQLFKSVRGVGLHLRYL